MAAGRRAFNHKTLHAAAGAPQQHGGKRIRRDDRQEIRTQQGGRRTTVFNEEGRIEDALTVGLRRRAVDADGVGRGLVARQRVQHARELYGDAGADDHDGRAGEHRAVGRRQMGELDFLKIVDADRIGMALACKKDLHKVGNDA